MVWRMIVPVSRETTDTVLLCFRCFNTNSLAVKMATCDETDGWDGFVKVDAVWVRRAESTDCEDDV